MKRIKFTINDHNPAPSQEIEFDVLDDHGPALRSSVDEMRRIVGRRLENRAAYPKEQALTAAAVALGSLAAAINAQIPSGDPDYSA